MLTRPFGPIRQIGYVVENVDAAMALWTAQAGIGPWTCFRNVVLDGRHLGAPARITMNVGLGYQGEVQIELIEVVDDGGASPYRGADGHLLAGQHHVAWLSHDLAGDIARAEASGLAVRFRGGNATTQVAYLESAASPGTRFELIEVSAPVEAMFRQGIEASRVWDGSGPAVTDIDLGAVG